MARNTLVYVCFSCLANLVIILTYWVGPIVQEKAAVCPVRLTHPVLTYHTRQRIVPGYGMIMMVFHLAFTVITHFCFTFGATDLENWPAWWVDTFLWPLSEEGLVFGPDQVPQRRPPQLPLPDIAASPNTRAADMAETGAGAGSKAGSGSPVPATAIVVAEPSPRRRFRSLRNAGVGRFPRLFRLTQASEERSDRVTGKEYGSVIGVEEEK